MKLAWIPALRDLDERRPSAGPNVDALDGVRGLAVLLVVASHNHGLGLRDHGELGVWLFFCLSAFLLTLPIARDPGRLARGPELRRYVRRRVGRIVPLYWCVLLFWFGAMRGRWDVFAAHALFLRAELHFWTIPQELAFYVALPLLGLLHPFVLRRNGDAMVLLLAGLAAAASWTIPVHTWALGVFLTGMAFAYACTSETLVKRLEHPRVRGALVAAGWASLGTFFATAPDVLRGTGDPSLARLPVLSKAWPGTFAIGCGLVVAAAYHGRGSAFQRLFTWRPLRSMGIVSYSVYLISPFVTYGLYELGLRHGNAMFVLDAGLSWAIGLVTYSLIERPFLKVAARA